MTEKNIEDAIKKYLRSKNIFHFKVHGSSFMPVGLPDIIACYKGLFVGIEVKNTGLKKTQSLAQKVNEENIIASGGHYLLVDSFNDFLERFDKI